LFLLFFIPVFVAALRSKQHPGGVVVVNLLLGWTVIGWIVALAMSASGGTTRDVVAVQTGAPAPTLPKSQGLLRPQNILGTAIVVAFIALLVVISYGMAEVRQNTSTVQAATAAPATPAPHIGTVVRGGNWQYEVLKVDTSKTLRTGPYDFEVLTPKGVWIVVAVNLTNVGDRNFTLNDWDLELRDNKGIKY